MALMLKCGAVFLHVPKTGGSWVTKVLTECGLVRYGIGYKHADMQRVMNYWRHYPWPFLRQSLKRGPFLQRRVREAYKFCFVRHPLGWYESWYKYASLRGWPVFPVLAGDAWHPNAWLYDLRPTSFNDFVEKVIRKRPGYVTEMYGWYATPEIDSVGKQEHLVDDLVRVLDLLGIAYDQERLRSFSRVNESHVERRLLEWDPGLRAEVERLEHAALVRYGYVDGRPGDAMVAGQTG